MASRLYEELMVERIYKLLLDIKPEVDFKSSNNYIEDGLLDSIDMVALVAAIDKEFKISIDGFDIVPENFVSAEAIEKLLKERFAKNI